MATSAIVKKMIIAVTLHDFSHSQVISNNFNNQQIINKLDFFDQKFESIAKLRFWMLNV